MSEAARSYKWLLWASLVVMLATAGLSPLAPWGNGLPARDSSAFLYIGKVWAETGQGYSTAWDNKGPALFGLEALGHLISPRLGLGIWLIDVLCYCGAALILAAALRRMVGDLAAGMATLVFSGTLAVTIQMGNYTEGFCLPLIAGGIWLAGHPKQEWGKWAVCGVLIAAAGLMRANNAVGLALVCFFAPMLFTESEGKGVRWQTAVLAGAVLGGFFAAYQAAMGAREYGEMLYAMWGYNRSYSSVSLGMRAEAVLQVFFNLTNPVLLVGVLAVPFLKGKDRRIWGWFGVFWVQAAALGVSGRTYMHYSVILLPFAAVLFALVLAHSEKFLKSRGWQAALVLFGVVLPFGLGVAAWKLGDRDDAAVRATVAALREVEGETLYVMGHQASICLLDGRRYGSRMFTDAAFQIPHPRRAEFLAEWGAMMRADPPDVIVFQRTPEEMAALGVGDVVARYEVLSLSVEGQWPVGVLRE